MRKILIFLIVATMIMGMAGAVPRWGPPNGFYTKYLDADTITADVITSGVSITEDGSIGTDVTFAADKFLKAATGTGYVDLSAATGIFKGPTGVFTFGGDVSIPSSQAFNMGDGAAQFGGALNAANVKANTTLYSAGTLNSAGTATLNAVTVNGTATLNGAVYVKCNATTSISTTLTATDAATVYPVDASAGHVTLTLPDPTTVDGRMYTVSTLVDMGGNNVIVATTGTGKIGGVGGADTLTTTDITAALTVISDGTHYVTIGRIGTWT